MSAAARGQSLVEFALVLPVFILVLVGLFDVGRAVYAFNTISNASREAVRVAIVNQTTGRRRGRGPQASRITGRLGRGRHHRVRRPQRHRHLRRGIGVGCLASVTVEYYYTAATPVIGQIIGPFTMSATTEMPVERTCPDPSHSNLLTCPWPNHEPQRSNNGPVFHLPRATGTARPRPGPGHRRCRTAHHGRHDGLVIDGGFAWGKQRDNQNAADAASEAGAVVLAEALTEALRTDADVLAAVNASVAANERDHGWRVVRELQRSDLVNVAGRLWADASGGNGLIPGRPYSTPLQPDVRG